MSDGWWQRIIASADSNGTPSGATKVISGTRNSSIVLLKTAKVAGSRGPSLLPAAIAFICLVIVARSAPRAGRIPIAARRRTIAPSNVVVACPSPVSSPLTTATGSAATVGRSDQPPNRSSATTAVTTRIKTTRTRVRGTVRISGAQRVARGVHGGPLVRVVADRPVRRDRVVDLQVTHGELDHHVVVLVHEVVAVHHVAAAVVAVAGGELDQRRDRLVLAEVEDVLAAALPGVRLAVRRGVAADDLAVDQVDVQRVEPAAGLVDQVPDLHVVRPRVAEHPLEVGRLDVLPGLPVD